MDKKEFLRKCQLFENDINLYSGSDPLQCRFEYIKWLEENKGKENAPESYRKILVETVNGCQQKKQYHQDRRFITLIINLMEMESNKVDFLKHYHELGIGTSCAHFYEAWSAEFIKKREFAEALSVLKKGFENQAQPSVILITSREKVFFEAGQALLSGNFECKKASGSCIKCSNSVSQSTEPLEDPVKNWLCLPLKVGDPDDFSCPMVVPDPDDPSKVPCYPKDEVYKEGQEFQLEEVLAKYYFLRLKKQNLEASKQDAPIPRETRSRTPKPRQALGGIDITNTPVVVVPCHQAKEVPSSSAANAFPIPQNENMMAVESQTPHAHTPLEVPMVTNADENQVPSLYTPLPLLLAPNAAEMSSAQSFTVNTKMAFNMINEMWTSPKVTVDSVSPFVTQKPEQTPVPSQSSLPFNVFSDNSVLMQQENMGQARASTMKKSAKGGLTERFAVPEPVDHPARQKLAMPCDGEGSAAAADDILACRLDGPNLPNVPPAFPQSEEWAEEATCDTKAFYNLIATRNMSTPNVKGNPMIVGSSSEMTALKLAEANRELSVITEVSKERVSQSQSTPVLKNCEKTYNLSGFIMPTSDTPFSHEFQQQILLRANFPSGFDNCFLSQSPLPTFNSQTKLGTKVYSVISELTKGSYGKVVRAVCVEQNCALKIVKPPSLWEYYIVKQIQHRLGSTPITQYFMDVKNAFSFKNGSVLETEFCPHGSLLNCIKNYKKMSGNHLDQEIVLIVTLEIISILEHLHKTCSMVHCNLKVDNILMKSLNKLGSGAPFLQLIDFCHTIDMKVFPPNTVFSCPVPDCDMIDNKPWNYQIDMYGLAGIIYFLLRSESMKTVKRRNKWYLQKPFSRSVANGVWDKIVDSLLNIESSDTIPDLSNLKKPLLDLLASYTQDSIKITINKFINYLNHVKPEA